MSIAKSPTKAVSETPTQDTTISKAKGKAPMNPPKKLKGNPLNTTSCEGFIPYNQGVEIYRRTKKRQEEIQEILPSQSLLEGGAIFERRSKRKQEQPAPSQSTAPTYKRRKLLSPVVSHSSTKEDLPENQTNLPSSLPENQTNLPSSQTNSKIGLRELALELAQLLSDIPQEIALGDLMAFPLRGVRPETNEVINFPSVASSSEESQEALGHARETPIDLIDNPDSHTSPVDRSSLVHEQDDDIHQDDHFPLYNQGDEVDRADTEVLANESPSSDMRTPHEGITHPFSKHAQSPSTSTQQSMEEVCLLTNPN
ncbi:hypothetical protein CsSME_00044131 [Camellia sinensis var. sinensis]